MIVDDGQMLGTFVIQRLRRRPLQQEVLIHEIIHNINSLYGERPMSWSFSTLLFAFHRFDSHIS